MGAEREDAINQGEAVIHDPEHYILHHALRGMFEEEEEVREDHLYIPAWELSIYPFVARWSEQSVILRFRISSPKWDRDIFETSAGIGDSAYNALGMAAGGFALSLMQGIASMELDRDPEQLETSYGDTVHKWKVYRSSTVGMGAALGEEASPQFWAALKEGIAKRAGNQKLCYIKIFASKNGDDLTGECRINDIPCPELGEAIQELAGKWQADGFASQKQFIFLQQSEETYTPYPYGQEQIAAATKAAVEMFAACETQEQYEAFPDRLAEVLQDQSLAEELYAFLPEICAENAFEQLTYTEEMSLYKGGEAFRVYRTQLTSYSMIYDALFAGFREEQFNPEVYKQYIGVSSIYSVICNAKEQGADLLEHGGVLSLSFSMSDRYQFR